MILDSDRFIFSAISLIVNPCFRSIFIWLTSVCVQLYLCDMSFFLHVREVQFLYDVFQWLCVYVIQFHLSTSYSKYARQSSTTVLAMSSFLASALPIISSTVPSVSRSMYVQVFLWPIRWILERLCSYVA